MDWRQIWNDLGSVTGVLTHDLIELLKILVSWPSVALIALFAFRAEIGRGLGKALGSINKVNILKGEIEFASTRLGDIANSASAVAFDVNHFILVNNDFGFKLSYRRYSDDRNYAIEIADDQQLQAISESSKQNVYAAVYWKRVNVGDDNMKRFYPNINVLIQGNFLDSEKRIIDISDIKAYNRITKLSLESVGGKMLSYRCNLEDSTAVYETAMPLSINIDDKNLTINVYTLQRVIIYGGLAYLITATTASIGDASEIVKKEMAESVNSFEIIRRAS